MNQYFLYKALIIRSLIHALFSVHSFFLRASILFKICSILESSGEITPDLLVTVLDRKPLLHTGVGQKAMLHAMIRETPPTW